MAEDNKENEEQGGAEAEAPSSKKKLIIIIALVVVVLGVAGAVVFFMMGDSDSGDTEEEVVEEVVEPPIYLPLSPPILSTFNVEGRQRYMQVSLSVMSRSQEALDAVDYHMPVIRSKLNALYGGVDFKMVQSVEGKLALQEETVEIVNGILEAEGEPLVESVYFTNFVMQ